MSKLFFNSRRLERTTKALPDGWPVSIFIFSPSVSLLYEINSQLSPYRSSSRSEWQASPGNCSQRYVF